MAKSSMTTKITPEQEYKKELRRIKQFIRRASKRGFFWEKSPIPNQPKKITSKSVERLRKITPDVLYKKGEYVVKETGELIPATKGRKLERKRAVEKAKETRKAKLFHGNKFPKDIKKETTANAKNRHKHSTKKKTKQNNKQTQEEPRNRIAEDIAKQYEGKRKHNRYWRERELNEKGTSIYSPDDEAEYDTDDTYYPNFIDIVLSNFREQLSQFPNAEGTPLLLSWLDTLIADNGREAVAQMLQEGAEQGLIITWETVYKSVNTKTYMTEMMNYLPDQGEIYKDQIMDMMEQFEWWEQPE